MKKHIVIILTLSLAFSFAFAASAMAFGGQSTEWTDRIWGEDRIETAIEISEYTGYSEDSGEVVFCTSENWPDALAASTFAGCYDANILINPSDKLDDRVKDELEKIADEYGGPIDVTIIGGTGAISEDIEDELDDMGDVDDVERISGKDRYETAAKVAEKCDSDGYSIDGFFFCTGENWPDALAASYIAYYWAGWSGSYNYPILLVKKDEIPSSALDVLLANKNDSDYNYVIGGSGVISSDVMETLGYYLDADVFRIWGDNRYETCMEMIESGEIWDMPREEGVDGNYFTFATGDNWPDALTGSVFGDYYYPIILTGSLDESVTDYFSDLFDEGGGPDMYGYVLGGKGAVDKETEDDIAEALSDGDFEPTTEEPTINSFDVTINDDGGDIDDIPDVAQYDPIESLTFEVNVDSAIENEDGTFGKVVIEDISELGGDVAPYNEADYELTNEGPDGDDWIFRADNGDDGDGISEDNSAYGNAERVTVKKKSTSPEQREVTFVAKATNQAGSDTMESDSVEVYN